MKKQSTIILFIFILLLPLSLSGCSGLLVRNDALITDQNHVTPVADVQSFSHLGDGLLQDVTSDGRMLLVFSTSKVPPTTYNIELYQVNENNWTVTNFLSSEKSHVSGIFSSDGSGIFYTETETDHDTNKEIRQLVWMSMDRKTTLVLSEENENVISSLYRLPDRKVLYANSSSQIVITDADRHRETYTIDSDFQIETLYFNPVSSEFVFIGSHEDHSQNNLYLAKKQQNIIEPILLDQNIVDVALNSQTGSMAYIKKDTDENQLVLYTDNGQTKQICLSEMTQVVLNSDDSTFFYTLPSDNTAGQYQMIEMMDLNGKNIRQVTSPRTIVSEIFLRQDLLFFSELEEGIDSDNNNNGTIKVLKLK